MSTLLYCIHRGLTNLTKNMLFTVASTATIAACIFLFCLFFSVFANVSAMAHEVETTIGISVFFEPGTTASAKQEFETAVLEHGGVREMNYRSADEAWESFKEDYFGDNADELAEAFADDNPLAESDSYEIFMENIADQQAEAEFIESFDIVREVNYANSVVEALNEINRIVMIVSAAMISILFLISVFLISNTINLAAHVRRRENEIMRLIGATNGMIRAPFVVEGTFIGTLGAAIPLAAIYFIYDKANLYMEERLLSSTQLSSLRNLAELLPFTELLPVMLGAGLILGTFMGFTVSFITIGKHLKV